MKKLFITLYEDAEEKEYTSVDTRTIKAAGYTSAEYRKTLLKLLQEDADKYNEEYIEYVWEVIDEFTGKTYKVGNAAWLYRIEDDAHWLTFGINQALKDEKINYSIKKKDVIKAFKAGNESGYYNLYNKIKAGEFKAQVEALKAKMEAAE